MKDNIENRSCRNCNRYLAGYGFGAGSKYNGPQMYIACEFSVEKEKECKENMFEHWEQRGNNNKDND